MVVKNQMLFSIVHRSLQVSEVQNCLPAGLKMAEAQTGKTAPLRPDGALMLVRLLHILPALQTWRVVRHYDVVASRV